MFAERFARGVLMWTGPEGPTCLLWPGAAGQLIPSRASKALTFSLTVVLSCVPTDLIPNWRFTNVQNGVNTPVFFFFRWKIKMSHYSRLKKLCLPFVLFKELDLPIRPSNRVCIHTCGVYASSVLKEKMSTGPVHTFTFWPQYLSKILALVPVYGCWMLP